MRREGNLPGRTSGSGVLLSRSRAGEAFLLIIVLDESADQFFQDDSDDFSASLRGTSLVCYRP